MPVDESGYFEVTFYTATGRRLPFRLSATDPAAPVWPGGVVWGLKVPLAGPDRLVAITATWPGWTDTIAWPEASAGAVSQPHAVPPSQAVARWWPATRSTACRTGVPAAWIAAETLVESGGEPAAARRHGTPCGRRSAFPPMTPPKRCDVRWARCPCRAQTAKSRWSKNSGACGGSIPGPSFAVHSSGMPAPSPKC